jgi:Holliday junction resolvasome RuvABC endonuclease subunit
VSAILAIDPGIHTGWALLKGDGKVTFGQENLNQPAGRVGQRFLALGEWLAHIHKTRRLDLIAYEKVMHHKGVYAAHAYGGFIAILTAFCEREQIDYAAIPVGTIKKHWVDDGRASKAQMMEEALGRGFKVTTDNEADALALLDYARKKYAVEQDGWITILPETK